MKQKRRSNEWEDDGVSRFTVIHNRWDAEDYQEVRKSVAKLPVATDALAEIITEDRARPEMSDVFMLFMKASPDFKENKEIADESRVSKAVNEQLKEVDEFTQLRRFTRGDMVGSALAAIRIEPTLETLFDRVKKQQEQAEKLSQMRKELQKLIREKMKQQPQDGEGQEGDIKVQVPGQGQGQQQPKPGGSGEDVPDSIDEAIEQLQKQIDQMEQELQDQLEGEAESMQATLSDAMGEVLEDAQTEAENMRAWGVDPGQHLRLPADVRLKLAAKMNQARLRKIAELFGPMHNLAIAPRQRRVEDIPHEIKRVTLGKDLNRLIPKELVSFDDEDLELDFLKRFANRSLVQYKMDGTEKVGKGGLVVCVDSSGSMQGTPEMMSKAVALCLLNICKKDGREFHLIHFGSPGELKEFSFKNHQDFNADKVIEAAEYFMNGGTDFVTPLERAISLLESEFNKTGRVRSDIVFLTDGICGVPNGWIEKFHTRLKKLDAACWGIAIGCPRTSKPLFDICQEQVCEVKDLHNAGVEIKDIFKKIQR